MPRSNILNDYTAAEIAAAREKAGAKRAIRPCLWCEKSVSMRHDQHFCSSSCRAAYARAAAEIEKERAWLEKAQWRAEREALVREIQRLRKKTGEPEFNPDSPALG